MIVLFSDFGLEGPYIGQVKAVTHRLAPGVPVIDLFSDAPAFSPRLSAYLLAAYADAFQPGDVFLAVVDPGVGSDRPGVVLQAAGRWYVGPGNGLFEIVARRAEAAGEGVRWWCQDSPPAHAAPSFHGRDVFAPAAAHVAATGTPPAGWQADDAGALRHADWPDDLARVVYIDRFGNVMTGLRAAELGAGATLVLGPVAVTQARTFSDVPPGATFWYENANGLAEIAVNQGRAADHPGGRVGGEVTVRYAPGHSGSGGSVDKRSKQRTTAGSA